MANALKSTARFAAMWAAVCVIMYSMNLPFWAGIICNVVALLVLDFLAVQSFVRGNTLWDGILKVRRRYNG
ncbi:hypothetical protein [Brevundimonas sp.]|uniref:hypothetical protein n=1 Tax=Brevundimonas sp. TaxID=1871086 RepID=UPI00289CC879|nr:hypothetical protein [Brevundimonas sp.]